MAKKSFATSDALEAIEFDVDGDDFLAVAPNRLPAYTLIRYSEQVTDGKLYEAHKLFFNSVLTGDSAERFDARLNDRDKPITLPMMIEIAQYLIEAYSDFNPKK